MLKPPGHMTLKHSRHLKPIMTFGAAFMLYQINTSKVYLCSLANKAVIGSFRLFPRIILRQSPFSKFQTRIYKIKDCILQLSAVTLSGPVHAGADQFGFVIKLERMGLTYTRDLIYLIQFGSAICTRLDRIE